MSTTHVANGLLVVTATVNGSTAVAVVTYDLKLARWVNWAACGPLTTRSMAVFTSLAPNAEPSWFLTPLRSLNVHVRPSVLRSKPVASVGTNLPSWFGMYRKSVMAHISGKMSPPTAHSGSTKPSCTLGTPMVTVEVLASVRAGAAVVALPAAPPLLEDEPAVVAGAAVVPAAAVGGLLPLLSPPQAASKAARPAPALPSRTERRDHPPPKPKVPGSTGGMV